MSSSSNDKKGTIKIRVNIPPDVVEKLRQNARRQREIKKIVKDDGGSKDKNN